MPVLPSQQTHAHQRRGYHQPPSGIHQQPPRQTTNPEQHTGGSPRWENTPHNTHAAQARARHGHQHQHGKPNPIQYTTNQPPTQQRHKGQRRSHSRTRTPNTNKQNTTEGRAQGRDGGEEGGCVSCGSYGRKVVSWEGGGGGYRSLRESRLQQQREREKGYITREVGESIFDPHPIKRESGQASYGEV